jgi:hypothetical protein
MKTAQRGKRFIFFWTNCMILYSYLISLVVPASSSTELLAFFASFFIVFVVSDCVLSLSYAALYVLGRKSTRKAEALKAFDRLRNWKITSPIYYM